MAISASAVWEVRSTATAANANGGFFVTGSSGTATVPIVIEGYNSTRGDNPKTLATRPIFDGGTALFTSGNNMNWTSIHFKSTNTATGTVTSGTVCIWKDCRFVNTGTTASKVGFTGAVDSLCIDCDFTSFRGQSWYTSIRSERLQLGGIIYGRR